jgi:hypothetical protein
VRCHPGGIGFQVSDYQAVVTSSFRKGRFSFLTELCAARIVPGFGGREFPVPEMRHHPQPPRQFEQSDFNLAASPSPALGAPAIDPAGYSFDRTVSEGRSRFRSCRDDSRIGEFSEYQ